VNVKEEEKGVIGYEGAKSDGQGVLPAAEKTKETTKGLDEENPAFRGG